MLRATTSRNSVTPFSKMCVSFWKMLARTWQDIIDVTVFLTNMKKDFPVYNKLYAEYFAGDGKPNPTRTTD